VDATDLVVGDVVKLKMGDKVPADLLIIASKDLTCTEGDLTGEPDALDKARVTPENSTDKVTNGVCFCKALVSTGNCTALVVAVGEQTAAG
jgi:P-type E1-E2 ATPase